MIRPEESLEYHQSDPAGKVEVRMSKPCLTPREMRLAYLPGASYPSLEIARDQAAVFRYTARGNLVGVVTNGSAVPGLGNVGPYAAKPMQEGIGGLFKRLADIDVFDLELDTSDPGDFVQAVRMLEPTFGAINLKDISAPEGLLIYDRLSELLSIPVFHENLYSTAVVAAAALINALDLVEKRIEDVQVVVCGAGTVGTGCVRLLRELGVEKGNLLVYDVQGLIHPDRTDLHEYQRVYARSHSARELAEGVKGADVLIGASSGGVFGPDLIRKMRRFPVVLALATPDPEIGYAEARAIRKDLIVATALGGFPNAVVDTLSFPYILRGALDVQATSITTGMLLSAAQALAGLAREEVVEEVERVYGHEHFSFGPEYLLPKPIDPRILVRESSAVAQRAIADGVARQPLSIESHQNRLTARLGTGSETLRNLILRARRLNPRVVLTEGASETVLRASSILVDEGIARPILLGHESMIQETAARLDIDLAGVQIVDPARSPRLQAYAEEYLRLRRRRGIIAPTAVRRLLRRDYYGAMMLRSGDADMMIAGATGHYAEPLRTILEVIGPDPSVRRISSHYLMLRPKSAAILADCAVNIDPGEEDLAEIAILASKVARSLGLEPRVAMLSFSNFGSVDHSHARKVRRATEIVKERAPDLVVDGEMQLAAALDSTLRHESFPFSDLDVDANVLVFPDLQSGNLALQMLEQFGEVAAIGPVLMGTRLPAHAVQLGITAAGLVHLTTAAVVELDIPSREEQVGSP